MCASGAAAYAYERFDAIDFRQFLPHPPLQKYRQRDIQRLAAAVFNVRAVAGKMASGEVQNHRGGGMFQQNGNGVGGEGVGGKLRVIRVRVAGIAEQAYGIADEGAVCRADPGAA